MQKVTVRVRKGTITTSSTCIWQRKIWFEHQEVAIEGIIWKYVIFDSMAQINEVASHQQVGQRVPNEFLQKSNQYQANSHKKHPLQ